jgi:cytochrome c-type biogenesis protein CcmH/NrfG
MPDLGTLALLLVLVVLTGAAVGWPLLRPGPARSAGNPEQEARELRHRIALEALLDVEADRRAGSLDDAAYRRERTDAEARAALTLAEVAAPRQRPAVPGTRSGGGRRAVAWLGAALTAALLVAFVLPEPFSLAPQTAVNQGLADALAREAERQAEIQRLLTAVEANPDDPATYSELADAYLAGSSAEDLQRAAVALQVVIGLDPENRSAYRRLITAYIAAGANTDAQAATDSYAGFADPDEPDIPFYRGLIAFRTGETAAAIRHFDRFLELAPDDDRAAMITSLRAEAVGLLSSASPSPGG